VVKVVDDNNADKGYWLYSRLTDKGLLIAVEAKHTKDLSGNWGDNWWKNTCMQFYIGASSYANRIYVSEFLNTGFTYTNFATTGSSGNYTTIFEGFIDTQTLTHLYGFNGNHIRIGLGFRVNDGSTTDTITVNGTNQTFWYADSAHPLLVNNIVTLEGEEPVTPPVVTPPTPDSSDTSTENSSVNSSTSTEISTPNSSTNNTTSSEISTPSSISNNTTSSENSSNVTNDNNETSSSSTPENNENSSSSSNIENTNSETSSNVTENKATSCNSSLNVTYVLAPLFFIALIIFVRKLKNNN
jgi:hypothetical protein